MGAKTIDTLQQEVENQCNVAHKRIAVGALPRGLKVKPLVHEFSSYTKFFIDPQFLNKLKPIYQSSPKQPESPIANL